MSDEEILKIWEAMFGDCVTARSATAICDYKRFIELIKLREQQIYDWVEREMIGDDEQPQFHDPYTLWGDTSYRHVDVVFGHNDLRAEQRAILQAKREGK